jgi:predicted nuclease of restriction endonuclease-like (RecB) superfamily
MHDKKRQDLHIPNDYRVTLAQIKERIRTAQHTALIAVNRELIQLYWDIGKTIVDRQNADPNSWGKAMVQQLSKDLQTEFNDIRGFSSSNLWRMRNFFLEYQDSEKLAALLREISWTHNIIIMERCKDILQREFYMRVVLKKGWSSRELIRQIDNQTYERTILNQTNFSTTLPGHIRDEATLSVKDEYTFTFLEMGDDHSERQLELAIIRNLPDFLREMGVLFTFVGNQFRIKIKNKELFIDILLFHRKLKCLVAIDLKVGEFKPEYVGKMLFYLSALEEHVCEDYENPPIGIILCKTKNRTVVEYTIKKAISPIGVAQYHTVEELPEDLQHLLPNPDQIERLLEAIPQ